MNSPEIHYKVEYNIALQSWRGINYSNFWEAWQSYCRLKKQGFWVVIWKTQGGFYNEIIFSSNLGDGEFIMNVPE
jgi:hypothetical protein